MIEPRHNRQETALHVLLWVGIIVGVLLLAKRAGAQEQLLPLATRQAIVQGIPHLDDAAIEKVVRDPRTVWYTRAAIGVVYQRGGGIEADGPVCGFALANKNRSQRGDRPDGLVGDGIGGNPNVEGSFPWSQHPGGGHDSPGLTDFKAVWLPKEPDGSPWPILGIHEQKLAIVPGGRTVSQRVTDWIFPTGATFLEVELDRGIVFEVRSRRLDGDTWDVDAQVPFATAAEFAEAIRESEPNWPLSRSLSRLVGHLESKDPLAPALFVDQNRNEHGINVSYYVDALPPAGHDALIAKLMNRPFESRLNGEPWRVDAAGHHANAPSVVDNPTDGIQVARSIVPKNWLGAATGSDGEMCASCHNSTLKPAREFDLERGWYGDIRGNDGSRYTNGGIFSWHPVDLASIPADGTRGENWKIRDEWAKAFAFEGTESEAASKWPADHYLFRKGQQ